MNHNSSVDKDIQCLVSFSMNGNSPVECPIITSNHPLGIAECGLCLENNADAMLSLSMNNELVIEKTGHAEVIITRSGRQYQLKPGKSISIFRNDTITIDHSNIHILKESIIYRQRISASSHIKSYRTYVRILCTIAAIFTLCAVHTNVYGQTPNTDTYFQNSVCTKHCAIQHMILKKYTAFFPKSAQPQDNAIPEPPKANTMANDSTVCKEGEKICLSNRRYECINHRWKSVKACQRPTHCTTGDSYCDGDELCKNGKYLCDDDEIYKCIDGKWTINERCEHSEACEFPAPGFFDWLIEPEPKCVEVEELEGEPAEGDECEGPQMKCESNAVMACRYGFWEYVEICENRMQCQMISDVNAKCVERRTMGRIIPEGHIVR